MRRTVFVLAAVMLSVLAAGGAALAAERISCPNEGGDRCVGTERADEMLGSRGDDTMLGLGGADLMKGRAGSDEIRGGAGDDRIVAARCAPGRGAEVFGGTGDDGINVASDCGNLTVVPGRDEVDCGPGNDVVRGVGRGDRIAANCERVIRG